LNFVQRPEIAEVVIGGVIIRATIISKSVRLSHLSSRARRMAFAEFSTFSKCARFLRSKGVGVRISHTRINSLQLARIKISTTKIWVPNHHVGYLDFVFRQQKENQVEVPRAQNYVTCLLSLHLLNGL
jgi:hypothetical protein